MSLTNKAIKGAKWSFIGNILNQITTFTIGIILARLLSPEEFGLIGMTTVFIVLADTFVDSGFSQALIRKNNCTQEDYSTAFYFNLLASILIYLLLFFSAGSVANFFIQAELTNIIRIASLGMIINSLVLVQKTILVKDINFKIQTKISIISTLISGVIALLMAINDFGVWSLVVKSLSASLISAVLFWGVNKWRPDFTFSKKSFDDLFSFGSKLLFSNLIDRFYWNIYYVVIGKYFSPETLGYYTRAEMFKNLPSQNVTSIIINVSYPALTKIQDDLILLRHKYLEILKITMFIVSYCLVLIFVLSEPIIFVLIGKQWAESVPLLKILCISAFTFPASLLSVNLMKILKRSDIILKIEPLKKIFAIFSIIIGISFGLEAMLYFLVLNSVFDYFINISSSGKLIGLRFRTELSYIFYASLLPLITGVILFFIKLYFNSNTLSSLIILISISAIILLSLSYFFDKLFFNRVYKYLTHLS